MPLLAHPQCKICQLGVDIDPSMTNAAISRQLDVSKDSVRRHKAHMAGQTDSAFPNVPVAAITSRGTTLRLPDGSYEKVTWNPNRAAFLEALSYDDIERTIEGFQYTPPANPSPFADKARFLITADWQLGKTDVGGGSQETTARVLRAFYTAERLLEHEPVQHLVIADVGDIIENFQNTKQQAYTNDLSITAQIRAARRLLVEGIKMLAPLVPKLTFVSVPSNHCQVRAEGSKDLAGRVDNDWGIELHEQIKDVLTESGRFENVAFVRPQPYEEAVTVAAGGAVTGFTHGHQAGKAERVADWWRGQSHGRRSNLHNADYLVHGHFHNLRVSQSGDARWLFGAPSADPGSTWFTGRTGERATAGTLTYVLEEGQWSDLRIL